MTENQHPLELLSEEKTYDKYMFGCDISQYRGLLLYNPNVHEISFGIRFDCGENSHFSCDNVNIEIEYFINSLIKQNDIAKENKLWAYAVDTMNITLIEYLIKHKSLFDINCKYTY